jgi:hypothetical protein
MDIVESGQWMDRIRDESDGKQSDAIEYHA